LNPELWSQPTSSEHSICEQVRAYVYPYLDGELGPQSEQAVRCHLFVCRSCQEFYDTERHYLHTLRAALRRPCVAPADLKTRVSSLLRHLRDENSV